MKNIRNFCIIAHIDHGKSTLADRLIEFTNTVQKRDMMNQLLDDMDLERERGITIKSHAIQMQYPKDGEVYTFNLIDTPGHVDFSYEVSRSIAACEGALLIVDASQGIEAQTISNLYLAINHDLEIIPVLNKIDLPGAMPDEVSDQIIDLIGCKKEDIIHASGKEGIGIQDILDAVVARVPAPKGDPNEPLQALIFDSTFNSYRGIEVIFRIYNGEIKKGDRVKFINTGKEYFADEIGTLGLEQEPKSIIKTASIKAFLNEASPTRSSLRSLKTKPTFTQISTQISPSLSKTATAPTPTTALPKIAFPRRISTEQSHFTQTRI
jgi:GTP-binding protein LepA